MKRFFAYASVVGLLTLPLAAQDKSDSVGQDIKDAGHSTKEAAKKTGRAVKNGTVRTADKVADKTEDAGHAVVKGTKKAGHKVKHGTKKVINKGAEKTEEGAGKVRDKTDQER